MTLHEHWSTPESGEEEEKIVFKPKYYITTIYSRTHYWVEAAVQTEEYCKEYVKVCRERKSKFPPAWHYGQRPAEQDMLTAATMNEHMGTGNDKLRNTLDQLHIKFS